MVAGYRKMQAIFVRGERCIQQAPPQTVAFVGSIESIAVHARLVTCENLKPEFLRLRYCETE